MNPHKKTKLLFRKKKNPKIVWKFTRAGIEIINDVDGLS